MQLLARTSVVNWFLKSVSSSKAALLDFDYQLKTGILLNIHSSNAFKDVRWYRSFKIESVLFRQTTCRNPPTTILGTTCRNHMARWRKISGEKPPCTTKHCWFLTGLVSAGSIVRLSPRKKDSWNERGWGAEWGREMRLSWRCEFCVCQYCGC